MKTSRINKGIKYSSVAALMMSALISTVGYAIPATPYSASFVYAGFFGGVASPSNPGVNQYASAYFPEFAGGPLAVNAFGTVSGSSEGMGGAKVGFQWGNIALNQNSDWGISPAIEVQGYYIGSNTYKGDLFNNTARLPEHDFRVSFPTQVNVYLMNAIINFNVERLGRIHPFVGAGLGGALSRINGASAFQIAPPEPGINHYSANTSDTAATFAGQATVGFNVTVTEHISLFATYQYLYLSSLNYTFGSTVAPGHAETSPWLTNMEPQSYNMGTIGIQFNT